MSKYDAAYQIIVADKEIEFKSNPECPSFGVFVNLTVDGEEVLDQNRCVEPAEAMKIAFELGCKLATKGSEEKTGQFRMIPLVEAADMPREVTDYCVDREISIHSRSDITCVEDDGNPLAEWLKV